MIGACAAVLLAGAGAFLGWRRSPVGSLAWDGQDWRWESTGYLSGVARQQLSVLADFQSLLLLRIENEAHASLWLLLERKTFPARWMDLRRAVFAAQPSQTSAQRKPATAVSQASAAPSALSQPDIFTTRP